MLERYKWMSKRDPGLQAELEYTPFSPTALAREIHQTFFPELEESPQVFFSMTKYVAYIVTKPPDRSTPYIVLNPLYNHPQTPEVVVRALLKHEFIHFVIPARQIDGKRVSHPPEFWEMEQKICPERQLESAYEWANFGSGFYVLPEDEHNERCLFVRPSFVRKNRHRKRVSLEECLTDEPSSALDTQHTFGEPGMP